MTDSEMTTIIVNAVRAELQQFKARFNPPKQATGLPQTGWYTDEVWCAAFGESVTAFRDKIRKHKIPYIPWGNSIAVNAEDLFAQKKVT